MPCEVVRLGWMASVRWHCRCLSSEVADGAYAFSPAVVTSTYKPRFVWTQGAVYLRSGVLLFSTLLHEPLIDGYVVPIRWTLTSWLRQVGFC